MYWLDDKGVEIITEAKFDKITKKGLAITTKDGNKRNLTADTIITALPMKPNTELIESLKGMAKEFYAIGDANEPHLIFDAIADGARIGRDI